MLRDLDAVRAETGEPPNGCPWRAFAEPDVIATLHAYDWFETGQCAEWWGADPEWWLVAAVRFYHRVLHRSRASVYEIARNTPEAPPPPLGGEVVHRVRA